MAEILQPEKIELPPTTRGEIYQLHQLKPDLKQIRVLNIAPGEDEEPIACSLDVVSVETGAGYTALSYVWGAYSVERHTIICDGVRIEITTNCHSALWHLRKKLGRLQIWVDALCINQEDNNEKSLQLPLMGDIYSKASWVYVWLGEDTSKNKRAGKTMAYLATAGVLRFIDVLPDGTQAYRPYAAASDLFTSGFAHARHRYLVYLGYLLRKLG